MRFLRLATVTCAVAALATACSGAGSSNAPSASIKPSTVASQPSSSMAAEPSMGMHPTASASSSMRAGPSAPAAGGVSGATDSKAADLRVKLDLLLGEHIILATKATGAALGGRQGEFAAYGDLLNTNGTDIGAMIGAAFGNDAKDSSTRSGAPTTASSWTTRPVWPPRTRPSRTRRSRTSRRSTCRSSRRSSREPQVCRWTPSQA